MYVSKIVSMYLSIRNNAENMQKLQDINVTDVLIVLKCEQEVHFPTCCLSVINVR